MRKIDTIQINKFSKLHNNIDIFFCKTEFIYEEFEKIKNLKKNVVLITGNSDDVIDKSLVDRAPKNIIKWYAQNSLITNQIISPIPIGIANLLPSHRNGHGIGWGEYSIIREKIFSSFEDRNPNKFIYANFNIHTNFNHRTKIRELCINSEFIDWEEPTLSDADFLDKLLDYEAVICPQGNGMGDNHRIYETLYMNRIPVTFNKVMYDNLHHLFPVVLIENYEDLTNYEIMKKKINQAKSKSWDKSTIEMDYWINKILNFR